MDNHADTFAPSNGPQAREEHRWLQRLVGEWSFAGEALMGPGEPSIEFEGVESVRTVGDFWVVAEGRGEICEGIASTVLTLGVNPQDGRIVGTFIASTMDHLWIYDGKLDGQLLILYTEGPDQTGKTIRLRDTMELQGDHRRVLSSHIMGEDGQWRKLKEVKYLRHA